ncbi:MAG: hypothetical protein IJ168_06770 [Eubacterium sp.]|nr:hypothetical protein [Eubacterium sp.]
MIYDSWMHYIRDDVKMTALVIPGAHNAGSCGMGKMAECQADSVYTQFCYGVRQFCLRLSTDRRGKLVLAHGLSKGEPLEKVLREFRRILREFPEEVLLLDLREYYPQQFGPVTVTYRAAPDAVNALLAAYIDPEQYAYTDFGHISEVTLGDIKKAGKRFLLINDEEAYAYSKNCDQILPWEKAVNGALAADFSVETLRFFDDYTTDGLYWFQTQQTPNPGTPVGLTTPRRLDETLRPYFQKIIDGIAENPRYLARANIIAGDFMTLDYAKCAAILRLNLLKGNVVPDWEAEFATGLDGK